MRRNSRGGGGVREVIRRNWRFWVTLAEVLALTMVFAHYIGHRQALANSRAERQRQAICAILANIPGHIPAEIAAARIVFARPGHPGDCLPIVHPAPKPTPAPTVTIMPTPQSNVIIQRQPAAAGSGKQSAAPPRSLPSAAPTRSDSPTPSPTCLDGTGICLPPHG